jgi:hypothetical protein
MFFIYFIRPVPSPLLLEVLCAQLKCLILASGNPQEAQVFFCLWKALSPHLLHKV